MIDTDPEMKINYRVSSGGELDQFSVNEITLEPATLTPYS